MITYFKICFTYADIVEKLLGSKVSQQFKILIENKSLWSSLMFTDNGLKCLVIDRKGR